ncbi:MAG: protein-disulfide reductase DsbD [Betaproteobacteria bacterium]|nr:MAG: protein-disulfide reductase DsbD [Betaproteobacteria bacterium]
MKKLLAFLFLVVTLAAPAAAQDLLEPEKAFRMQARALDAQNLEVRFAIADGYYMYRERFKFALEDAGGARLGAPVFPAGVRKTDEFFGEVETYRKEVAIRLPVDGAQGALKLLVTSQGCADTGVCYVPMDSRATIQMAALTPGGPGVTQAPLALDPQPRVSLSASDLDVAAMFQSGSFWLVLASFLGFGVLLAFTPCVLPMVPILSGIIIGEGKSLGKLRALILSVAYVLGMAVAYAAAGVAAAYSGSLIAAALQNAWVLGAFALVFVALALSMFGFYEIRLPSFLHHRLHAAHGKLEGGKLASVAMMGVLSAVIVSPCVAAPLAGALLYISQTRDVLLGGAALFAMALGMGLPLLAVGVSEGALMPRSGVWMNSVRRFFGVLLLAVAIWIVSPVLPEWAVMTVWAALAIGSAMFLRAIDPLPANAHGTQRLAKAAGIMALIAGVALLVGALAGSRDPLRPLAGVLQAGAPAAAPTKFVHVASVDELDQKLRAPGRPVMLDFYADWCVSCKEMEAFTFSDPRVRARFETMLLLQADVTANTEAHKLLLKRFSLFGPPGIIFFDTQGREIRGLRVVGYQNADNFLKTLDKLGSE